MLCQSFKAAGGTVLKYTLQINRHTLKEKWKMGNNPAKTHFFRKIKNGYLNRYIRNVNFNFKVKRSLINRGDNHFLHSFPLNVCLRPVNLCEK